MNNIGLRPEAATAGPGAGTGNVFDAGYRVQPDGLPVLTQYIAIIRRRKWVIIGAILATVLMAMIATLLMTPLYTARATIEIQRDVANIVNVEGVEAKASTVDEEFYQTQYGLLRARSLAERVARDLRLYQNAPFLAAFGLDENAAGGTIRGAVLTPAQREARVTQIADILLENIDIAPVRLSRLVELSFTSPDPQVSRAIVDAWSQRFIEQALERRFDATAYARRFLEERLAQTRGRLEASERLLVSYAARQGIVNLSSEARGTEGSTVERPLVADQLTAINTELQRAIGDRINAQSRAQAQGTSQLSLTNGAINALRQRRAEVAAERSRLLVQYEPEYPQVRALAEQVAQLDRAISAEEGRIRAAAQSEFQANTSREAALNQRVENLKGELLDNRSRSIQYNIYLRDVDTNRQLYEALLQRYKEVGVAGGVGINNIAVVDAAELPDSPSSPNIILNLLIGLLAGMTLGAGLAFAMEQVDEAVADPTEIEKKLRLPMLGAVPRASGDLLEELRDRKSPIAEAYWSVQASLEFSTDHGVPHSIVVTSTRPGEGKSTTSYAVAKSLARTGRRVLLIDGDMRSPSVHHIFDFRNEAGLSNYLTGENDLAKLITQSEDGIGVMTAGPQPPNAAELLTGPRFSQLIQLLRRDFDHVIIDAPPVMGLADAPLLTSRVEGTIYVIESHGTRVSMAMVAMNRLRAAQAHLLGCVLTKFESKRAHYGYGYDYGYGYGEGDGRAA